MSTLQIIIWVVVAVCALGTLIAAIVVNRDKLRKPTPEDLESRNTEDKNTEEKEAEGKTDEQ